MKKSIFALTSLAALCSANVVAQEYSPIVNKAVYLTKSGMVCELNINSNYDNKRDFCDASGSIDIRVNVAQMRSIPVSTENGLTPDAKLVRFTVSAEQPGSGFHLVDELKQDHSWYQTSANRTTFIGPFASSYNLSIQPISGYVPKKVYDFPSNENKSYSHSGTHGVSIGVNGNTGVNAGVNGSVNAGANAGANAGILGGLVGVVIPAWGAQGGINGGVQGGVQGGANAGVGSNVGASYVHTNEQTLSFNTQDYRVKNSSSASDFSVSFEHDFTECDKITEGESACTFAAPFWSDKWVYDKSKFNPITYANFKPNYDVLYETPVTVTDTTIFRLSAGINYSVYFGKVLPTPLLSTYKLDGSDTGSSFVTQDILVDWSHPLFSAEVPVVINSLDDNNTCLSVDVEGKVNAGHCSGDWRQTWGLDANERYQSREVANSCLAVSLETKDLIAETCGTELSQKWYWEGNKLVSRYVDGTNQRYILDMSNGKVTVSPEAQAANGNWVARLQDIKL